MYRSEITLENFRYLMRNVNFRLETKLPVSEYDGVIYDSVEDRSFATFKEYFATVGKSQLIISDKTGNKSYTGILNYKNPKLTSSETYLICYDMGGNDYSLYTYFTQVRTEKTSYPIYDVSVSDNGYYAIATKDDVYKGIVDVYNNNFKQITRIKKNKYIVSVDMDKDGGNVLVTSFFSNGQGEIVTEISLHPTDSKNAVFTVNFNGLVPCEARFLNDGTVAFVSTKELLFLSSNGATISSYEYGQADMKFYSIGPDSVALCSAGRKNTLNAEITDCFPNAEPIKYSADGPCVLISKLSGKLYFYNGKTLNEYDSEGKLTGSISRNDLQFILSDAENETYLCGNTRIEKAVFTEKENS